jgi:hypothetical protein
VERRTSAPAAIRVRAIWSWFPDSAHISAVALASSVAVFTFAPFASSA